MFNCKSKYITLAIITAVILISDQLTKHLIHSTFKYGESLPIIQDFFDITYVRNSGAAFGLLHTAPPAFRDPFFLIVPIIALIVILFIFIKLTKDQKWTVISLSLIFGGAIGNLIDRFKLGYVIDFLDFHWKEIYHYPAFNVADSCIVTGVGLMLIQSLVSNKMCVSDKKPKQDTASKKQSSSNVQP